MDNDKKLFDGLLKADGIDPAGVSESERAVFREMLDSEQKRMKHLCWCTNAVLWIFALAMIGLCVSENILEALHIPFVVGWLVVMAAMLIVMIRYMPGHNRKLRESGRKISKLYYLVHGKHRGLILIGKKNGKRFIYWPRILMIAVGLWLIMSLGGAGVFYLLCQRWLYSSVPWFHIELCTVTSLAFVIIVLREGIKAPLEELVEIKPKSKQSKPGIVRPGIWRIIMKSKMTKFVTAAVIIIGVLIGINQFGGRVDLTTIAFAEISEAMSQVSWMHQVSTGFERGVNGKGEQWFGFEAKVFAAKPEMGQIVFYDLDKNISYNYDPKDQTIRMEQIDNFPLNLASPVAMLESLNDAFKAQGAEIVTTAAKYDGQKVQLQEISMSAGQNKDETHTLKLYVDPESKRLVAAQVKGIKSNGEVIMDGDITFSYPTSGPSSIYDLGVPQEARIINNTAKD